MLDVLLRDSKGYVLDTGKVALPDSGVGFLTSFSPAFERFRPSVPSRVVLCGVLTFWDCLLPA